MLNFIKMNFSSQLIGIQDGYLSLLTESGEVREDLKLPEGDLGKEIEGKFNANEDVQVQNKADELWLIALTVQRRTHILISTICISS